MVIMFAPNSLVRQKEGTQGEVEERWWLGLWFEPAL